MRNQTIYVKLLEEAVDVWRPVVCSRRGDMMFELPDEAPSGEHWEFAPGSLIVCELREFSGDPVLVATQLAS